MTDTRSRSTKACDHCRLTKSKCVPRAYGDGCKRCDAQDIECTTISPARRRGPPKGYLSLVETRLHELQALLGLMLSIPDPHLQSVFKSLANEELGGNILGNVERSAFGPEALQRYLRVYCEPRGDEDKVASTSSSPTNAWQAHALREYLRSPSSPLRNLQQQQLTDQQLPTMQDLTPFSFPQPTTNLNQTTLLSIPRTLSDSSSSSSSSSTTTSTTSTTSSSSSSSSDGADLISSPYSNDSITSDDHLFDLWTKDPVTQNQEPGDFSYLF